VAILGSDSFHIANINTDSVEFAGAPPATDKRDRVMASPKDVDGDDKLDLVMQFRLKDTDIRLGDTEACLTGETSFGAQPFQGCDSISVRPERSGAGIAADPPDPVEPQWLTIPAAGASGLALVAFTGRRRLSNFVMGLRGSRENVWMTWVRPRQPRE